jgi:hypothetical protein
MLRNPGTFVSGGIVMSRGRTFAHLSRTARGVLVLAGLALVSAAPAAAAQPTRTVTQFPANRVAHFPAGDGCTFDATVLSIAPGHGTVTDFGDGREVYEVHAMKRAITSDVTGKTFVENQQYRDVEWIDPTSGLIFGQTSGQFIDTLYPGDMGPYGVVDQNVSYAIIGWQTYVLDPNTFATLSITIKGTITDICATIS